MSFDVPYEIIKLIDEAMREDKINHYQSKTSPNEPHQITVFFNNGSEQVLTVHPRSEL